MLDRLRELYEAADEATRERGRAWYAEAQSRVWAMALRHNVSRTRAACVLAITSPRCSVDENFKRAERALAGERVRGFSYMDRQCAAPIARINGPKVVPFAKAILGNVNALVLDVWALRACGIEGQPTAAQRREVDAAYRALAAETGETVRDLQAIVWIQCRQTHESARPPQLAAYGRRDIV